ncbi:MAG: alanine racemase [Prevotellaceae bacterium]|jgi:alanine racemase|nr:alanine racemase [Prevotellaceae bacterium]
MLLSQAADLIDGKLYGDNPKIGEIFIDSRSVPSDAALFFALKGERHDGHNYINELYGKGLRAFVVERRFDETKFPGAGFVLVHDALQALQTFAAAHRSLFHCRVVGVAGSNGKTCVKEWAHQLLQDRMYVTRNPKSYNSQVGVPLSVMLMNDNTEIALFEAGISKPDEMSKLESIIKPTTGIFTNLGDAHQENFPSAENKLEEKMKLFAQVETLIYCADQKTVHDYVEALPVRSFKTFTWGRNRNCDLRIKRSQESRFQDSGHQESRSQESGHQESRFQESGHQESRAGTSDDRLRTSSLLLDFRGKEFTVQIPFADPGSVENALHCVALALVCGCPTEYVVEKIRRLSPVAMRMEIKEGVNGCTVINDTYNSDINSLSIALDFLGGMTQHRRKTLILSDILQSGDMEDELYRKVAESAKAKGVSKFRGIGTAIARQAKLFANIDDCVFYADTDDFIRRFSKADFNDEAVLIKGSRTSRFERISRLLEYKTHQTILEIDLNALVNNINYFKSKLRAGVKLMAMVKAFSYGAGTYEIAALLQYHHIDYLAVAYADEGVELREAGIRTPIVVLNADPDSFDTMVAHRLEPEIYNFRSLREFVVSVARAGASDYPVHLKLDTGMHRLGFAEYELPELCIALTGYKELKIASIFSHLAASDEALHDDFTEEQIAAFRRGCEMLEKAVGHTVIKHILNSSGIERFPHAQFDMVRLGLGLYGIGSSAESREKLQNTGTLSSAIVQIKQVPAHDTVGYGRRGKTTENKRIATVPIGYADGLNRKLSCGAGYFMVNGKPAPIIGNICMDSCMIDVTEIEAEEGDRVIIFGNKPSVSEIAETIGTIPYEVLTSISQRVKRVYLKV